MKYDKILYDTAVLVTSGTPKEFLMFQLPLGADSSHDEDETNNPFSGQVSQDEVMTVYGIEVQSAPDVTLADLKSVYKGAYLQVKVKDTEVFHAPLLSLASPTGFSGSFQLASAADVNGESMRGVGLLLRNPIIITASRFIVRLVQFTSVVSASNLRVCLNAEIDRK